jgi:hypothetical protein
LIRSLDSVEAFIIEDKFGRTIKSKTQWFPK